MWRSIKLQIFALAFIPPLIVIVVMTVLLSQNRLSDIEEFAQARANALINQMEIAAQQALLHNNIAMLQSITNVSLEEKGLRTITIYDNQKKVITHSGMPLNRALRIDQHLQQESMTLNINDLLIFIKPLHPITDDPIQPGWIIIAYQQDIFLVKRYEEWLLQNVTFICLLLIFAGLGLIYGTRLSSDLSSIGDYLKRLSEGNADQAPRSGCQEIDQIANAISDRHQSIAQEIEDLEYNIELTSGDLRSTIESMEIQNIQLSLMQKEAQAASQIKSEFLANTSHEIRTPLNGILGFTRILKRTPLNPQQVDYVETIEQSSQGLLAIINDILDFSKIEAGKLQLEETLFDLQQCCEEVISLFAPAASEKKIELVLMFYQDVPQYLMGDAMRIRQLLSNLVSNAIKFSHHGTIVIRVALEQLEEKNVVLSFSVQDNGIGMDKTQTQHLFKAFNQANASISREYGGTGLGLAIVKKLVDLLKGDITVESEPNQGTTIIFTLRLRLSDKPNNDDNNLQGKSVLLLEGNTLAAHALRHTLEHWHIHVQHAKSFSEAEDLLTLHHFDTIIYSADVDQHDEDIFFQARQLHNQSHNTLLVLLPIGRDKPLAKLELMGATVSFKPTVRPRLYKLLNQIMGQPQTSITTPNLQILAVDDQPTNLKLLAALFADKPIQLYCAKDGMEAIALCQQQRFHLILMDIQMPGINGIDTSIHIRSAGLNKETPIIAITAHAMDDEKNQLLQSGMNDYISKPVDEEQLNRIVAYWVNSENAYDVVDIAKALSLAQRKKDLAIELFEALIHQLPETVAAMKNDLDHQQIHTLLQAVHKLHGLCCYTAVPLLKKALSKAESYIKQHNHLPAEGLDEIIAAAEELLNWQQQYEFSRQIRAL